MQQLAVVAPECSQTGSRHPSGVQCALRYMQHAGLKCFVLGIRVLLWAISVDLDQQLSRLLQSLIFCSSYNCFYNYNCSYIFVFLRSHFGVSSTLASTDRIWLHFHSSLEETQERCCGRQIISGKEIPCRLLHQIGSEKTDYILPQHPFKHKQM